MVAHTKLTLIIIVFISIIQYILNDKLPDPNPLFKSACEAIRPADSGYGEKSENGRFCSVARLEADYLCCYNPEMETCQYIYDRVEIVRKLNPNGHCASKYLKIGLITILLNYLLL